MVKPKVIFILFINTVINLLKKNFVFTGWGTRCIYIIMIYNVVYRCIFLLRPSVQLIVEKPGKIIHYRSPEFRIGLDPAPESSKHIKPFLS